MDIPASCACSNVKPTPMASSLLNEPFWPGSCQPIAVADKNGGINEVTHQG
jgi:hypothetical protein